MSKKSKKEKANHCSYKSEIPDVFRSTLDKSYPPLVHDSTIQTGEYKFKKPKMKTHKGFKIFYKTESMKQEKEIIVMGSNVNVAIMKLESACRDTLTYVRIDEEDKCDVIL